MLLLFAASVQLLLLDGRVEEVAVAAELEQTVGGGGVSGGGGGSRDGLQLRWHFASCCC